MLLGLCCSFGHWLGLLYLWIGGAFLSVDRGRALYVWIHVVSVYVDSGSSFYMWIGEGFVYVDI